jgi:mono/diheme cytochrome c family protein
MRRSVAIAVSLVGLAGCTGRPAPDATGVEIYQQLCVRCHGEDLGGRIGPALGPGSEIELESYDFIRQTIHDGRGRMPSFAQTLSDEQIDRVIDYLREVQDD